jgi:hypothetical protein
VSGGFFGGFFGGSEDMPTPPPLAANPPPGLRHAPEAAAEARWVRDTCSRGPGLTVAHFVPPVFEAYARLLHPTQRGRRWVDIAAQRGIRLTATTRYEDITRLEVDDPAEGARLAADAAVVAEVLRGFTSTPGRCLFLVGGGATEDDMFGDLIFGGSRHVVLTGDVMAVTALAMNPSFGVEWESPIPAEAWWIAAEAWWPADRCWFVYTNSDGFDTHLGGAAEAIEALIADDRIEALPIAPDDEVDISPEWGRPD